MRNTIFPVKKTFSQDFITKDGKNLFTLSYDQATLKEYFEFQTKTDIEKLEELYGIIRKSIKPTFTDKIFLFINPFYKTKIESRINIDEVMVSVYSNRYRIYESVFEGIREKVRGRKGGSRAIESFGMKKVCSHYCISPTDLMNNYTLEQYLWFQDGIEFDENRGDKEGDLINKLATADKEGALKRAKETRKKFESLKK